MSRRAGQPADRPLGSGSWPMRRQPPSWWLPVLIAGPQIFGSWAAGAEQPTRRGYDVAAFALLTTAVLALGWRARFPVPVLAVVAGVTAGYYGAGYPYGPAFLALVVATVGAVLRGRQRATWSVLAAGYVLFLLLSRLPGAQPVSTVSALRHLAWLAAVIGVAELIRNRSERIAESRRRAAEASRRRASEERLLLASELHDVLAHSVSLINVQASTALYLFDTDPQRARTALAAIKQASSETLQELRATVGALRADGQPAPRSPTAGLDRVEDLLAATRAVGLDAQLRRLGTVRPLPTGVDLAAFRIVQEALTNARRHSGASTVSVHLDYRPDELALAVIDDGRGGSGPGSEAPGAAEGHGLRGMRERALALGGSLHAGPVAGGGFTVSARLPLTPGPDRSVVRGPA